MSLLVLPVIFVFLLLPFGILGYLFYSNKQIRKAWPNNGSKTKNTERFNHSHEG